MSSLYDIDTVPILIYLLRLRLSLLSQIYPSGLIALQASLNEKGLLFLKRSESSRIQNLVNIVSPPSLYDTYSFDFPPYFFKEDSSSDSSQEPVLYSASSLVELPIFCFLDQEVPKSQRREEEPLLLVRLDSVFQVIVPDQLLLGNIVSCLLQYILFPLKADFKLPLLSFLDYFIWF